MKADATFKAYNVNRHLGHAVADASRALKEAGNGRASESVVMQAALVRFLSAVRPGCRHLKRFLQRDDPMRDLILNVAGLAAIPSTSEGTKQ